MSSNTTGERWVEAARADRDHAARRALAQRRREQAAEQEVTEMIAAELHLESVARAARTDKP
jgi:hypothetical protein